MPTVEAPLREMLAAASLDVLLRENRQTIRGNFPKPSKQSFAKMRSQAEFE